MSAGPKEEPVKMVRLCSPRESRTAAFQRQSVDEEDSCVIFGESLRRSGVTRRSRERRIGSSASARQISLQFGENLQQVLKKNRLSLDFYIIFPKNPNKQVRSFVIREFCFKLDQIGFLTNSMNQATHVPTDAMCQTIQQIKWL